MSTQADSAMVLDTEVGEELDVQDVTEQDDDDQATGETPGGEEGDGPAEGAEDGEGSATDEVVVTIGEESPASEDEDFHGQPAPEWVRDLRKKSREDARRIRELEDQVKASRPVEQAVQVGAKPTLEGCEYDGERFERELTAWHERKRAVEAQQAEKRQQQEQAERAWKAKLDSYGAAKAGLKVKDFDDAEAAAQSALSVVQQGIVVSGSENPALLVYALGKNPKKAKELAAITDPVKFAFAVAKLETQLKVTPRKAAPLPENTVRGSAPVGKTADATLARLEAEAEKTGDRSKVVAFKRQQRGSGK